MGMGVAAAGAVLAAFTEVFGGHEAQALPAFRATFACMALITLASAGIFWQLAPQDSRVGPGAAAPDGDA